MAPVHVVAVPAQDRPLVPPPRSRVLALKRHLVESLRDLREAKRPERLIQTPAAELEGFAATVVWLGCSTCQGHCCTGGGEHAYLDERTMARVRRDNPDLDAGQIVRLYVDRIADQGVENSCLFHGRQGCTLPKSLRAELCSQYFCNGLWDFMKARPEPDRVRVVAHRTGVYRESPTLVREG